MLAGQVVRNRSFLLESGLVYSGPIDKGSLDVWNQDGHTPLVFVLWDGDFRPFPCRIKHLDPVGFVRKE